MKQIILWQAGMLFVSVCVSAWLWKSVAVYSALLGGLCYLVPTVLAVLTVTSVKKIPELLPMMLLTAEIGKIIMASLMIMLIYACYSTVNWFAFLTGLILVSQAGLFTFGKRLLS